MYPADYRLEVTNVECPRIEVAVPSDDVERMVVEHELVDAVVLFYVQREIAHLIARLEQNRPSDVALGVGRSLDELSEVVLVARRIADVTAALEYHQLCLLSFEIHSEA